jgi:uncharacterized protein YegP (UPF0339 family)
MIYYIYKDNQGLWRWYVNASNGKTIAVSSESYYNKQDCLHGIELVQGSSGAPIYDLS